MLVVDADVGGVAADLKRIDPGLKVRFAEAGNPPFWAVYHESEDGRRTELVFTVQAHETASGTWSGLDQRVVQRIMEIGHSSYDYAAEVARMNERAEKDRRTAFSERMGVIGEKAAHALRKDTGARYKGRAFVPKGSA